MEFLCGDSPGETVSLTRIMPRSRRRTRNGSGTLSSRSNFARREITAADNAAAEDLLAEISSFWPSGTFTSNGFAPKKRPRRTDDVLEIDGSAYRYNKLRGRLEKI